MYRPTDQHSIDWDRLIARYEWLRTLADCPQDPIWHAEGDVLIHTRMVTEALLGHAEWSNWDAGTQTIMFWSALLHDVAKPMCTREENGRIIAPQHARKGAQLAQTILYQAWDEATPVPFAWRQAIVNLVRYHGYPLWFWDKPNIEKDLLRASLNVTCAQVANLSTADVLGRTCDDQAELLSKIDLFRDYAAENDCLTKPYAFPSDHSRFLYFRRDNQHPTHPAYDDTQSEVILMSGLPGAGKDTWLTENNPDYPVISLDNIRHEMNISPTSNQSPVIAEAKERAKTFLRQNQNFVWNATNITRQLRGQLIDLATDYQARVRLVYVEVPWAELVQRNQVREHPVPLDVLQKLAAKLEVPELMEASQVEWWTD